MMGGEPTLHPKFDDICKIYQKKFREERENFGPVVGSGAKKRCHIGHI